MMSIWVHLNWKSEGRAFYVTTPCVKQITVFISRTRQLLKTTTRSYTLPREISVIFVSVTYLQFLTFRCL